MDLEERLGELDLRIDSDVPDVPPPTDSTPEILKRALSGLSARYSKKTALKFNSCWLKFLQIMLQF